MKNNNTTLTELFQKAKKSGLFLTLLALPPFANAQTSNKMLTENKRIDAIIKQMTNEEKVDILIGVGMPGTQIMTDSGPFGDLKESSVPGSVGGTASIARFGIPATIFVDGPAGLRIEPKRKNDPKPTTQLRSLWAPL